MLQTSLEKFLQKEKTRFKLKVGVFLLLIQKNSVLLSRRFQTGIEDGMYVVPMGGHDGNEPVTCSMMREAKEEANIILRPENLTVCHVIHRLHRMPEGIFFEQMDVFFKAEEYEGTLMNNEPDHCDELGFYPLNALPKNISPMIHHAIHGVQEGCFFSEFGWNQQEKLT